MELCEMIKVMQHFDNSGEIEYSKDEFKTVLGEANKEDEVGLCWDWDTYDYRIKDEKQKVTIEKWLCQDYHGNFIVIETTGINEYYYKKVKLIKSYEVEL